MKDDKKSILVILGMFILLIMIVLPPVFRVLFPKEETNTTQKDEKMNGLTCTYQQEGNYSISADILYIEDLLEYYVINYSYTNTQETNVVDPTTALQELESNKEYMFFNSLNNVSIDKTDYDVTISLDDKLLEYNPDNEELKNYYQDIDSLEKYLTSLGYNCSSTTS